MRETFPTLAEAPRASWPARLRIVPPSPFVEGDIERVQCRCTRLVPADEMLDFRALTVLQRAALSLDTALCCAACFQLAGVHGRVLHSEIAAVLALAPHVQDAISAGERAEIASGHIARTALTSAAVLTA